MQNRLRPFKWLAVIGVLFAAIGPVQVPRAWALDQAIVQRTMLAVVHIGPVWEVATDRGLQLRTIPWGSGTILSPDGFILTNEHVVNADELAAQFKDDPTVRVLKGKVSISLTKLQDQPAVLSYMAEVRAMSPADGGLDLAVLQITEELSGRPVDGKSLNLPFVPLGDSDQLNIGQTINIFGYPGIGGETITFTSGNVSGFQTEQGVRGRAWIKTDTTIAGGNSGGTAVDDRGLLVGVPTQAGDVDCRRLADTNVDGRIDEKDSCIPIGGFLNQLRPANLARPLLEQAMAGIVPNRDPQPAASPTAAPRPSPTPGGEWQEFVHEAGEYAVMYPGRPAETKISDAYTAYELKKAGVEYSSGYMDLEGDTTDPQSIMSAALEMGYRSVNGRVESEEELPPLQGVPGREARYEMIGVGFLTHRLYLRDHRLYQLIVQRPTRQGNAREEARFLDSFRMLGDTTARGPQGSTGFSEISFASAVDEFDQPVGQGTTFPSGTGELYAFFGYYGMEPGMSWHQTWLLDGEVLLDQEAEWTGDGLGMTYVFLSSNSGALPGGNYELVLSILGKEMQRAGATIGSGAPTPTPTADAAPADGLLLTGALVDADTGKPVAGGLFMVLAEGITWEQYAADPAEDKVYDFARSDRNGEFALARPLRRGATYSLGAAANGYQEFLFDDALVEEDVVSPLHLEIALQRSR